MKSTARKSSAGKASAGSSAVKSSAKPAAKSSNTGKREAGKRSAGKSSTVQAKLASQAKKASSALSAKKLPRPAKSAGSGKGRPDIQAGKPTANRKAAAAKPITKLDTAQTVSKGSASRELKPGKSAVVSAVVAKSATPAVSNGAAASTVGPKSRFALSGPSPSSSVMKFLVSKPPSKPVVKTPPAPGSAISLGPRPGSKAAVAKAAAAKAASGKAGPASAKPPRASRSVVAAAKAAAEAARIAAINDNRIYITAAKPLNGANGKATSAKPARPVKTPGHPKSRSAGSASVGSASVGSASTPVLLRNSSRSAATLIPAPPPERMTTDTKPRKNQAGLNPRELDLYRQLLLVKRRELVGDMSSMEREALRSAQGSNLSSLPLHMADMGTDNYEQEFTLGLVEKDRTLLREINTALAKIQDGRYGICEGTGKPISKPRLEAQPWARFSIEYARLMERGLVRR